MTKYIFLFLMTSLTFLLGCGDPTLKDASKVDNTKPVNAAIDEEKLIIQGVESPEDPRTLDNPTYTIAPTSRLLLRFGAFLKSSDSILSEQPILLRLMISDTDVTAGIKNLQTCPILKNWMMYATWNLAHPRKHGNWGTPGGDIDFADCLTALSSDDPALKNPEEKDFCAAKNAVCYNLNNFFANFVRARNMDFGLAVINQTQAPANIFGKSTMNGAVLFWRKMKY